MGFSNLYVCLDYLLKRVDKSTLTIYNIDIRQKEIVVERRKNYDMFKMRRY